MNFSFSLSSPLLCSVFEPRQRVETHGCFMQAFYYKSHQTSLSAILDDIDKQIREKPSGEQQKGLKEARNVYREELVDCIRQCAW